MMRRLCAAGAALAVLLSLGGAIAMATAVRGPGAERVRRHHPCAGGHAGACLRRAVRGCRGLRAARRLAAREMSWQPLVGSSYFRVLPTVPIERPPEAAPEDMIRWRYPANWLIEVTLVEGCMEADFTREYHPGRTRAPGGTPGSSGSSPMARSHCSLTRVTQRRRCRPPSSTHESTSRMAKCGRRSCEGLAPCSERPTAIATARRSAPYS